MEKTTDKQVTQPMNKKEVVDIMITIYDNEEILKMYIESEREEAAEEAMRGTAEENARNMIKDGQLPLEKIAQYSGLTIQEVQELADMQLV